MLSILRLIILKFSIVQFFHHRIHLVEMVQQIMDITHISTVVQSVVMQIISVVSLQLYLITVSYSGRHIRMMKIIMQRLVTLLHLRQAHMYSETVRLQQMEHMVIQQYQVSMVEHGVLILMHHLLSVRLMDTLTQKAGQKCLMERRLQQSSMSTITQTRVKHL